MSRFRLPMIIDKYILLWSLFLFGEVVHHVHDAGSHEGVEAAGRLVAEQDGRVCQDLKMICHKN